MSPVVLGLAVILLYVGVLVVVIFRSSKAKPKEHKP
jgi:hypothetical protein